METFIVVIRDPVDCLTFVGPFSADEAAAYCESLKDTWLIVPLHIKGELQS